MQRSYSSFQRTVGLFVVVCFVNMLVTISAYAAESALPYNADLMLDDEYHDISYKVFEHREGGDPKPIDDSSSEYRSNALSLKQEMLDVLDEIYTEESNDLRKVEVGAIYFMYGYPSNLEVIFVSERKIERNYKRIIEIKDQLLRDRLRSSAIIMNAVKSNGDIKENFAVIMEMFSSSDIEKQNVIPEYNLTKVNPWILKFIKTIIVTVAVVVRIVYMVINGKLVATQVEEKVQETIDIYEKIWSD